MTKTVSALFFAILVVCIFIQQSHMAYAQQPPVVTDKSQQGSQEIFEYYNPQDVHIAMAIIAAAVGSIFLYLARDIILRKKSDYEKKDFASKHDRTYEKYHSEWTTEDEDFFGEKKESKEAKEFRKMLQESKLPNYYAVLGVASDATPEEIKVKYRKLVKEYHPDRTRDEKTAEMFDEVTKAYEVLSDAERRKIYDKYYRASIG